MRRRLLKGSALVAAACVTSLLATLAPTASAAPAPASAPSPAPEPTASQQGAGHGSPSSFKRVGYFTQWGVYGRNFQVKDLDTSGTAERLTHLNYAFGNVDKNGKCFLTPAPGESDPWADYQRPVDAATSVDGAADTDTQALAGNFNQIRELKAKHKNLKALVSLGGWSWSTNFSDAVLTPASRKALVSSCIDLYIKGNLPKDGARGGDGAASGVFDGIDVDWEWPGSAGEDDTAHRPEDKQNFTALIHEFRTQLDAYGKQRGKHYELSAFVPTADAKIDAGFEVRKIMKDFDFVNLQGYDFHVSGEKKTAQQSALFAPGDFSVHGTVESWLKRGAPARKLVVGMPFYGQGWTGVTGGGNGLGKPATGPAPAKWAAGYADYKELKPLVRDGRFKVHRDLLRSHAWLFDGTTLWTYDDPVVLATKAAYVRVRGLGGAMAWSLDADTTDGELMRAVDRGLGR